MTPRRVVVIGGGIAGLAAAHRLVESWRPAGPELQVTVVEARPRLGGTIGTETVDGFLVEQGADSFISEKPWALALAQRLGLGPRLRRTDDRFRRTYVVHRGRLHPLPDGWVLLAPARLGPVWRSPLLSWRGKVRLLGELVRPPRRDGGDESLAGFVTRRLGREVLERIAQPLAGGIYTADPGTLSVAATWPRFPALEREHGSVIRGLWRTAATREVAGAGGARWSLFVTLAGGMGELVDALRAHLGRATVRLGSRVDALEGAAGSWRVRLAGGETLPADAVVLAGQAPRMAPLVRPHDGELARLLDGVAYASSVAVTLAWPGAAIRQPLDAFGLLVPRREGRAAIACTFSSVKYPGRAPAGFVLLRVFFGGAGGPARHRQAMERDDAGLVRLARDELADLLGTTGPPVLSRVARYPEAMPQYTVGHLDRVAAMEARGRGLGLVLAGAAYRGVGIADCVRSGEAAAEAVRVALGVARGAAPVPEPLPAEA